MQFVCGLLYSVSCCAVCVWATVRYVLLCSLCVGYSIVCLVVQIVCGLLYSMSCCAVCVGYCKV